MTHRTRALVSIAIGSLALVGCFERSLRPVDPCTTSQQGVTVQGPNIDTIDLLIMVDNSSSMTEHQVRLREQIPRMISTLVTGTRDAAHGGNFPAPRSIHVGIVSSTMGLGPVSGVPGCPAGLGDDGILFTRSPFPGPGCPTTDFASAYPHGVFEFSQGDPTRTAAQYASDVSCVAVLGTGGCGLEFELEPVLKALSPAPDASGGSSVAWTAPGYRPPLFYMGTFGHGSDPATNGGFLRPGSALAILTLCDEDDGSTPDYVIFTDDPMYNGVALNVRPVAFNTHLFPIDRYVDGLIGLRRVPSTLIYSTITGIPNDLSPASRVRTNGALLDRIIADPRMQPMIDPLHPERLVPVCTDTMGGQTAVPGLRMVEVARGLARRGAAVSVHSICENDFTPAIDDIINLLADQIRGACLDRALNPDASGNVGCTVLELLPADGDMAHCASLPHAEAYAFVRNETSRNSDGTTTTREVCRLRQVGRAGAARGVPGWAYDDGDPGLGAFSARPAGCSQRIGLSVVSAVNGAEVRLECTETILPGNGSTAALGAFCDPSTGNVHGTTTSCTTGHAIAGNPAVLRCDAFTRSCEIACTTDSDCTGAGLLSYVCDARSAATVFGPAAVPGGIAPTDVHHFCVNPTCGESAPVR